MKQLQVLLLVTPNHLAQVAMSILWLSENSELKLSEQFSR